MENNLKKVLEDLKKVNEINTEIIRLQLQEIKKLRESLKDESEKDEDRNSSLERFVNWWYGEGGKKEKKSKEDKDKSSDFLKDIYKAITGLNKNISEPIAPHLKQQTAILESMSQEQALLRKISEGSLEYDKESAQYRNMSGREITSDVSGKTIKKGGYIDFETASNRMAGQSKAVIERAKKKEESNLAPVSRKLSSTSDLSVSEEDDNIQSPQEILADNSKTDLELTREIRDLNKEQLTELKKISERLGSGISPAKTKSEKEKQEVEPQEEKDSGGLGLGDVLSNLPGKLGKGIVKGAKALGRGAAKLGGSVLKFAGSRGGMIAGGALAIGAGAYSAYKGYTAAEEEQQAGIQAIDAKVQAGEITPEEAEVQKKQLGEATVEKKGGAIGEGGGMAAGAIGGMKAGAALGTVIGGPIGTGIGALAGGALGAFAGSKLGKKAGEFGGRLWTGIKNAPQALKDYNAKFAEVDKDKGFKPTERLEGTSAAEMMNAGVDASQQPMPVQESLGDKIRTSLFGSKAEIQAKQSDRAMREMPDTVIEKLGLRDLSDEKKREKYIEKAKKEVKYDTLSKEEKSNFDKMYSEDLSIENSKKKLLELETTKKEITEGQAKGNSALGMIRGIQSTKNLSEADKAKSLSSLESSYKGLELGDYKDLIKESGTKVKNFVGGLGDKVKSFFGGGKEAPVETSAPAKSDPATVSSKRGASEWDKMSKTPTVVEADGTRRPATNSEVVAAKKSLSTAKEGTGTSQAVVSAKPLSESAAIPSKRGTSEWDKMSKTPTVVEADGTRRPATSSEVVAAKKSLDTGLTVSKTSTENEDLNRQANKAAPAGGTMVVNNNSTVPPPPPPVVVSPSPRNDDPLGVYFTRRRADTAAFL